MTTPDREPSRLRVIFDPRMRIRLVPPLPRYIGLAYIAIALPLLMFAPRIVSVPMAVVGYVVFLVAWLVADHRTKESRRGRQ